MLADEPTGTLVYKSVATQNTVKKQKIVPPGAISFKTALDAFLFFFFFFLPHCHFFPSSYSPFHYSLPKADSFQEQNSNFEFCLLFSYFK